MHRFTATSVVSLVALGLGSSACSGAGGLDAASDEVASIAEELPSRAIRTSVDFDHFPINGSFDAFYASRGVTFSLLVCESTCVSYGATVGITGRASPRGLSLLPPRARERTAFEAHFTTPVSRVSIDALDFSIPVAPGVYTAEPWLEAYDSAGTLLGRVLSSTTYATFGPQIWRTLTIKAAGIARVRFSVQGTAIQVIGNFDNLVFTRSGDLRGSLVLTGTPGWQSIPVAASNGDGTFTTTNVPNPWWASVASTPGAKLVAGDFNGDGNVNLAAAGVPSWLSVPVAFSNGNGSFTTTNEGNSWWPSVAATAGAKLVSGDFDGDGKADLALTGAPNWASIPVAFSDGTGRFRTTNVGNAGWASLATAFGAKVLSGDVNGDGKDDLILTGASTFDSIPVALSNGDGSFSVRDLANFWWAGLAATPNVKIVSGDFNGDGRIDLAMTGASGWLSIPVALSNGDGSFTTSNIASPLWATLAGNPGAQMVASDIDGDGKSDLAMSGPSYWRSIPVAFSTGAGAFDVTNLANPSFPSFAATPGAKLVDQY